MVAAARRLTHQSRTVSRRRLSDGPVFSEEHSLKKLAAAFTTLDCSVHPSARQHELSESNAIADGFFRRPNRSGTKLLTHWRVLTLNESKNLSHFSMTVGLSSVSGKYIAECKRAWQHHRVLL